MSKVSELINRDVGCTLVLEASWQPHALERWVVSLGTMTPRGAARHERKSSGLGGQMAASRTLGESLSLSEPHFPPAINEKFVSVSSGSRFNLMIPQDVLRQVGKIKVDSLPHTS